MCIFCRLLFVLLSFFFWPLCYLSFHLRLLIMLLLWYYKTFLSTAWHERRRKRRNIFGINNNFIYYIRLYFIVFLLARSNTRDIPFSNILISKKQFLCNKIAYCTLVQNQWMKLHGTRVQYGFFLYRNCFLLINMLENFIKLQNYKIKSFKVEN